MINTAQEIFSEYKAAMDFKASLGHKGMYEQNKINERFFIGDQWYGAKCGNDRPLVRHNVIKRIGDYKMSQILSSPLSVTFSAEGISTGSFAEESEIKINTFLEALEDYYRVTAERVKLNLLHDRVLRNAYVTGTGVLYTYWDGEIKTGLYADRQKQIPIKGDIAVEVLDIENVFFGDPYITETEKQPYIIISSNRETMEVLREAERFGADAATLESIRESAVNGKITLLTKLFKEYKEDGSYTINSVKVCERGIVRPCFDTGLKLYPIAVFCWERQGSSAYGESEITYLIPNQIAINRMITANVWSAMTTGMPLMVINGDTVPDGITNEPGQIIKVYGSNEDVAGAVKYVSPPESVGYFDAAAQRLIDNTLTQSGANEVALGDSRPDNASALMTMRNAAIQPLEIIKNRFFAFAEELSRIWADFWVTYYGDRKIKIRTDDGTYYKPLETDIYKDIIINSQIQVGSGTTYNERECVNTLITLFDKGVIDRTQFINRLPDGILPDKKGLLKDITEEENKNDGV